MDSKLDAEFIFKRCLLGFRCLEHAKPVNFTDTLRATAPRLEARNSNKFNSLVGAERRTFSHNPAAPPLPQS